MHTAQRRAPQIASRAPNHFVVVCVLRKVVLKNQHTVSDLNSQNYIQILNLSIFFCARCWNNDHFCSYRFWKTRYIIKVQNKIIIGTLWFTKWKLWSVISTLSESVLPRWCWWPSLKISLLRSGSYCRMFMTLSFAFYNENSWSFLWIAAHKSTICELLFDFFICEGI